MKLPWRLGAWEDLIIMLSARNLSNSSIMAQVFKTPILVPREVFAPGNFDSLPLPVFLEDDSLS